MNNSMNMANLEVQQANVSTQLAVQANEQHKDPSNITFLGGCGIFVMLAVIVVFCWEKLRY